MSSRWLGAEWTSKAIYYSIAFFLFFCLSWHVAPTFLLSSPRAVTDGGSGMQPIHPSAWKAHRARFGLRGF